MAMKDYSDEFKADAVALYESTPGAIYKSTAADLGVNRATLRERGAAGPRTTWHHRCGCEAGRQASGDGAVR
ncbi:transposase [Streptomyces canus]|uniref:transposase n=1 Tax=Streptomyces canus TaxID=58343 RepID=UPI003252C89F